MQDVLPDCVILLKEVEAKLNAFQMTSDGESERFGIFEVLSYVQKALNALETSS